MERKSDINRCQRVALGLQPPTCENNEYPRGSVVIAPRGGDLFAVSLIREVLLVREALLLVSLKSVHELKQSDQA